MICHTGTGLLGDMPDAIKERIIGYATGRSSNLDDKDDEENGNKDTNSYDPTTGYWAKQVSVTLYLSVRLI